jgi:tungstate transport system permease protein
MSEAMREAMKLLLSMDKELLGIIRVTLTMSFFSTLLSNGIGIPLGYCIGYLNFKYKRIVNRILNTCMGIPPVVVGLFVYMLFTHNGPFGSWRWMYSVQAMVTAQCILITPLVINLSSIVISIKAKIIKETAKGIGLSRRKQFLLLLSENKSALISVVMTSFGRAIAEVGAVNIVGGNIQWKTRVMTTAIMLETNKGKFVFGLALGILLLFISLLINLLAGIFNFDRRENDTD